MQDFFFVFQSSLFGFCYNEKEKFYKSDLFSFFALNNKLKVLKDKKYEIFNYGLWFGFTI